MKASLLSFLLVGTALISQTPPAAPKTVAQALNQSLTGLERWIVPLAEAMPADKYDILPATGEFKGCMSFGAQLKHVAVVQYAVGASILGEKPPVALDDQEKGPADLKTKDAIVKYLKDAFVYAHKAVATVTDKNLMAPIKAPWGSEPTSRLAMANIITNHGMDHYGQLVIHLRLNGIIPPASRPK